MAQTYELLGNGNKGTHPEYIEAESDNELIKQNKENGFSLVYHGIESNLPNSLRSVTNTTWKNILTGDVIVMKRDKRILSCPRCRSINIRTKKTTFGISECFCRRCEHYF